ncbi:diguanylate cyclase domain-containing protein [Aciditerrimonas ferrireducens]|uniref:diguanylate cyclase domain-containing protein n=1 Tax=Aciditerrimonas ferrireducens TaxID=667306 RepID=UPI002004624A|nr:diguanylate cyclase [Aciditerrimonas ferrireducens]MCK4176325.1 diguanylate cyclase [Aciditerrimonas ferrireducens]
MEPSGPPAEWLRRIVEQIGEGVGVADTRGRIVFINGTGAAMVGWPVEELLGRHISVLHRPEAYRRQLEPLRQRALKEGTARGVAEHLRRDGTVFLGETTISRLTDEAGRPLGLVRTVRDLTGELAAQAREETQRERLATILGVLRDLVLVLGPSGEIRMVSGSWTQRAGYPVAAMVGRSAFDFVHPDDQVRAATRAAERLEEPADSPVRPVELRIRHADGQYRWYEALASPLRSGSETELVVTLRSIDHHRALAEQLQVLARSDALTGLANRRGALEDLEVLLDRWRVAGKAPAVGQVAVLFVDLDGFKVVNDTLGHGAGDDVLVEAGRRLRGCVRRGDLVARWGGDELLVVLADPPDQAFVDRVAERVAAALAEPFATRAGPASLQASVGVALAAPGEGAEEVVRRADRAMYAKKQALGRHPTAVSGGR